MKLMIGTLLLVSSITSFAMRGEGGPSEEVREAMMACSEELGLERPQRGERPSEEDRLKMDNCLQAKGIERPKKPERPARSASR